MRDAQIRKVISPKNSI